MVLLRARNADLAVRPSPAAPASEARGTLYSDIYDLDSKLICLYLFHDFDNVHAIDVTEELARGQHVVPLDEYFPNNSREADFRARYEPRKRKQFAATVRDLGAAPELAGEEGVVLHLPLAAGPEVNRTRKPQQTTSTARTLSSMTTRALRSAARIAFRVA
jgi:hypothetical protein